MKDIIAARRKAIRDAAPCEGCGTPRAACEAEQKKDPTAPFGCCSRERHVSDTRALSELLDEIESGLVRTVEEATPKPKLRGLNWLDYLDQGEQWKPNGHPMVRIADMDETWRYNASRWLERNAVKFAFKYTLALEMWYAAELASPLGPGEMAADSIRRDIDQGNEQRGDDPVGWIRTTALYRALVADLPDCSVALEAIAERAKHWSTCPARTGGDGCTCEEARARHAAEQEERHGVPEWTQS